MDIPFVGQSYTQRSVNVNAQRTVNFYLEMSPDGKTPVALISRPGLVDFATCGSLVRGGAEFNGTGYVVSGNKFYTVSSAGTVTERGTLNTSTGRVYMAFNGTEVMVTDGSAGYIYTLSGATFAEITDADYTGYGPVTYIDSYFIASEDGTSTMQQSGAYDGTSWAALDFVNAESSPDNLKRPIAHNNELVAMGDKTIEFFYNDAGTDFSFSKYIGAEIDTGLGLAASVVTTDGGLFFYGHDGIIYRLQGRQLTRISTHAVEYALQEYASISDAYAILVEWDGHKFYCLTVPGETTWVYDIATGAWVEWTTLNEGSWKPTCCFKLGRNVIVGYGTKLYKLDADTYTDDGTLIDRWRTTMSYSDDQKPLFCHKLELLLETGIGNASDTAPQVMLSWSDDGGHTFGNEIYGNAGDTGEYSTRVVWYRLGRAINRTWRIRMTDANKWVIQGATVEFSRGIH